MVPESIPLSQETAKPESPESPYPNVLKPENNYRKYFLFCFRFLSIDNGYLDWPKRLVMNRFPEKMFFFLFVSHLLMNFHFVSSKFSEVKTNVLGHLRLATPLSYSANRKIHRSPLLSVKLQVGCMEYLKLSCSSSDRLCSRSLKRSLFLLATQA